MNRFVLDCSVTMSWCFEDERTPYSERILDLLGSTGEAIVPSLWPYEVMNVLLGAQRRKRLTQAQAINFWHSLQALPINTVRTNNESWALDILAIAQQYHLSIYDASYLELALREGITLATLDGELKAASHAAGVLWELPSKK